MCRRYAINNLTTPNLAVRLLAPFKYSKHVYTCEDFGKKMLICPFFHKGHYCIRLLFAFVTRDMPRLVFKHKLAAV